MSDLVSLGRVDGFDQDHRASKSDECCVAFGCFLASERHAFEPLELAHRLLDASAPFVEGFGEEGRAILGVGAVRDDRHDPPFTAGRAIGFRIIAFVGDCRSRRDIGSDVERGGELG